MRIYLVKTPQGQRLVESATRGQAINHCISTDYSAEPISSSDLYAAIQQGAKVEQAAPAKKSVGGELSPSPTKPDSSVAAPSNHPASMPLSTPPAPPPPQGSIGNHLNFGAAAANAPAPAPVASPTASAAPAVETPAFLSGKAPEGGWQAPSNPILAEQQRINPDAAAAAGAPRPIISRSAPPPVPSQE
jgi:hypothetical protein